MTNKVFNRERGSYSVAQVSWLETGKDKKRHRTLQPPTPCELINCEKIKTCTTFCPEYVRYINKGKGAGIKA